MLKFHISCPSIRRFKSVMQEIATIEAQCYPKYMRSLQSINNREDLQYYCESEDVFVLQNNTTYLICTRDEVVDFASSVKLSLAEVVKIKEFLMNTFGNNVFFLDARKTTSYRLIKAFQKRGVLTVVSEQEWQWGSETFYSMNVKFN